MAYHPGGSKKTNFNDILKPSMQTQKITLQPKMPSHENQR
jgi:hypothetical protein